MVTHPGAGGVRPFLKLIEVQALRGAADHDLLHRFAAARDEAAFRVIAERHGPMVFGVCARLLGNRHDAEDALQATFLVFARRAAAVRNSESLASWLHGVARRVAARLRRADRRRVAREQAAPPPAPRAPADDLAWAEVRAGLDEELGRLPAAYREVLVLCYLEGLTRDEAGQRLGIDPGAVKGRLERGRRLLGERLTRRGIGLSAGLAGLTVAPPVSAAVRLARLATDPTAASPRAVALTHEFLKGVMMSKVKFVTAGLAGALVLVAGVGLGTAQTGGPPKPPPTGSGPSATKLADKAAPDTDEAFIRRVSKDLRGTDPTPAEVHFFLASKDANKRVTLVDLFVKERTDKGLARAIDAEIEKRARLDDARDAERRAYMARLGQAQARERAEADLAQADAAERERRRAAALADALAAERKAREAADKAVQDAEKRIKGFREANDPTAKPVPVVPPGATPPPAKAGTNPFKSGPSGPAPPPAKAAPGVNVEVLRVRVQLAEVTLREKTLAVRELEDQVKRGIVNPRELDRAKLEVDRAQLLLREAQLLLEAAPAPAARP